MKYGKAIGALAGLVSIIVGGIVIYQFINPKPPTPPLDTTLRDLNVRVNASSSIGVGGSVPIQVEVLSGPNSPISGAHVTIEVGGGAFQRSGQRVTNGLTNAHGFFGDTWTSPQGSQGITYLVTATVSKRNFETVSRRINIMVH